MNKIFLDKKYELLPGKFVVPFACSDIVGIDTDMSMLDLPDWAVIKLREVRIRITDAVLQRGYVLVSINFHNMSITVLKK